MEGANIHPSADSSGSRRVEGVSQFIVSDSASLLLHPSFQRNQQQQQQQQQRQWQQFWKPPTPPQLPPQPVMASPQPEQAMTSSPTAATEEAKAATTVAAISPKVPFRPANVSGKHHSGRFPSGCVTSPPFSGPPSSSSAASTAPTTLCLLQQGSVAAAARRGKSQQQPRSIGRGGGRCYPDNNENVAAAATSADKKSDSNRSGGSRCTGVDIQCGAAPAMPWLKYRSVLLDTQPPQPLPPSSSLSSLSTPCATPAGTSACVLLSIGHPTPRQHQQQRQQHAGDGGNTDDAEAERVNDAVNFSSTAVSSTTTTTTTTTTAAATLGQSGYDSSAVRSTSDRSTATAAAASTRPPHSHDSRSHTHIRTNNSSSSSNEHNNNYNSSSGGNRSNGPVNAPITITPTTATGGAVVKFRHEDVRPGDFLREYVLGEGSYSVVTAATHLPTGKLFALKEISRQQLLAMGLEERLVHEINIHRRLRHPNIVRLHSYFFTSDYVHLVLEYCPGGTLMQALSRTGERRRRRRRELAREKGGSLAVAGIPSSSSSSHQPHVEVAATATAVASAGGNSLFPPTTRAAAGDDRANGCYSDNNNDDDDDDSSGGAAVGDNYFSEAAVGRYARHIARALEHLHAHGVVHRDMKLENVLLDDRDVAKLADFGWSSPLRTPAPQPPPTPRPDEEGGRREVAAEEEEAEAMASPKGDDDDDDDAAVVAAPSPRLTVCGTLDYLSPEMLLGHPHSCRTDVWSLGVMLTELLTGVPPFYRSTFADTQEAIKHAEPNFLASTAPTEGSGSGTVAGEEGAGEAVCSYCGRGRGEKRCRRCASQTLQPHKEADEGSRRRISPAVEQLLRRMMDKDPSRRPTVAEVLAHPWLRKEGRRATEEERASPRQ